MMASIQVRLSIALHREMELEAVLEQLRLERKTITTAAYLHRNDRYADFEWNDRLARAAYAKLEANRKFIVKYSSR